jgi:thiol-disulfide isomerase/thioredoxin
MWATWCGPCRPELQSLQRLADRLGSGTSIDILTLNADVNPGVAAPYVQKEGIRLPVLLAESYVRAALKEWSLPRAWIVSPAGRIVYTLSGFQPDSHARWQEVTTSLLKELAEQRR